MMSAQKPTIAAVPLPTKTAATPVAPVPVPRAASGLANAFADSEPAPIGGFSGMFSDGPAQLPALGSLPPIPLQSGTSVPTPPTTLPLTASAATPPSVAAVPLVATAQTPTSLPAPPTAVAPPTATGGLKMVPVPAPKAVAPIKPGTSTNPSDYGTAGLPLDVAAATGQIGSAMFGSPSKSGDTELEAPLPAGQSQAQAPAPTGRVVEVPNLKTLHPAARAIYAERGLTPVEATPSDTATQTAPTSMRMPGNESSPFGVVGIQATGVGASLAKMLFGFFEGAMFEQPVTGAEEAETYLELVTTSDFDNWGLLDESQRAMIAYCLTVVAAESYVRLAQVRALVDGNDPIGFTISAETDAEVEARLESLRGPEPPLSVVVGISVPSARDEVEQIFADDTEYVALIDEFGDGAEDDFEDDGPDEGESSKANANAVGLAQAFADEPGPVVEKVPTTSTGVKLTDGGVRPYVEAYYATKKGDSEKQGKLARKLGLPMKFDIRRYAEAQPQVKAQIVNEGVNSLIKLGLKGPQAPAPAEASPEKPNVEAQMALMRQACNNSGVGCVAKRASHRQSKAQCFDNKCPCKGRCQQFVPPKSDGPEGGQPEAVAAGPEGVTSDGAGTAVPSAAPVGGGAATPPAGAFPVEFATEQMARDYVNNRVRKMRCARPTCGKVAYDHVACSGPLYSGVKGGDCDLFTPQAVEADEYANVMRVARALDMSITRRPEGGEGQQSAPTKSADSGPEEGGAAVVGRSGEATGPSGVAGGGGGGLGQQASVAGNRGRVLPPPVRLGRTGAEVTGGAGAGGVQVVEGPPNFGPSILDQFLTPRPDNFDSTGPADKAGEAEGPDGGDAVVSGQSGPDWKTIGEALILTPPPEEIEQGVFVKPNAPTDAETISRRLEITGRLMAWWGKMTKGANGEALNFDTASYRRGLAAMELTAQIERYATAHLRKARSPSDEELVAACTRAASAYLNVFKPFDGPDTDFGTYMQACEVTGLDPGTPWPEVEKALQDKVPF